MQVSLAQGLCVVFILCFGLGFLLVANEFHVGLNMMHQLRCSYVILCGVWTMIGVGVNMVVHNNVSISFWVQNFILKTNANNKSCL
jgi:hypothetical protein